MNNNRIALVFLRYFFLVLLSLYNLSLFYWIFTPITTQGSYLILNLIYPEAVLHLPDTIMFSDLSVQSCKSPDVLCVNIINSCVAGAAYYLLLILNFTTPMGFKTRIKSILFLISSFFAINVLRIVIFSMLLREHFSFFDVAHYLTWYIGSTFFVVFLWFVNIKLFKIKEIPVYSDFKSLMKKKS